MIRTGTAVRIGVVAFAAVMTLGYAAVAWGAPAPPNPAPTAAHPFQGLRRLTVATIPPVPGMQFAIDGQVFVANDQGIATTLVTKAQREAVRADRSGHLGVVTPVFEPSPGVRARFSGWSGAGQYRKGSIPEEYQRATFDIDYLTSFAFVTPAGVRIPATSLRSMQLTSSLGDRVRMRSFQSRWLQGSRTATGRLGLQSRAVAYRVDSVKTAGVNVVNQGQQQFFPSRQQQVSVELLFFNVRFSAQDALFGSATGSSIVLEYPDGHVATLPFRAGSVTVRNLPRGTYHVVVHGAGPKMSQKLTVSKNQRVDFDTVTWLDLALGAALLLICVVLLFVGRRWIHKRQARVVDLTAAERTEREQELVGAP